MSAKLCPPACLQYQKEKSNTPSNFTLKLRKHLRARRLEDVRQLGVDRIVDFQFGSGEAAYHLILELYSQVTVVCIVDCQSGGLCGCGRWAGAFGKGAAL